MVTRWKTPGTLLPSWMLVCAFAAPLTHSSSSRGQTPVRAGSRVLALGSILRRTLWHTQSHKVNTRSSVQNFDSVPSSSRELNGMKHPLGGYIDGNVAGKKVPGGGLNEPEGNSMRSNRRGSLWNSNEMRSVKIPQIEFAGQSSRLEPPSPSDITDSEQSSFRKAQSKDLQRRILSINDPKSLIDLVKKEVSAPYFDHVNALTCLHRLSKFMDADGNIRTGWTARLLSTNDVAKGEDGKVKEKKQEDVRETGNLVGVRRDAAMIKTLVRDYRAAIESLERRTIATINDMSGNRTANALWAFAKVQQKPPLGVLRSLENRLGEHISVLSAQALATALWAFGSMRVHPNGKLVKAMEQRAVQTVHEYSAQNAISVLWGLVRLQIQPKFELMDAIDARIEVLLALPPPGSPSPAGNFRGVAEPQANTEGMQGLSIKGTANLLWAWGRLTHRPPKRVAMKVEARVHEFLDDFQPRHLSNMMWAFGKLTWRPRKAFMMSYEKRTIKDIAQFETHGIASILWGHSRLMVQPSKKLMEALTGELLRQANKCNAQDVANTLYSFAKLSRKPKRAVFIALRGQLLQCRKHLNAQLLSNSLWAFAKLEANLNPGELGALNRMVTKMLPTYNAQAVGNTLWAYATLSIQPQQNLMYEINARMSFAKLLLEPTPLLATELARRSLYIVSDFKLQNVVNMLWAFARLGRGLTEPLARALEKRLESVVDAYPDFTPSQREISENGSMIVSDSGSRNVLISSEDGEGGIEFNTQDLSNSLWALAVLGRTDSSFFVRLWNLGQRCLAWNNRWDSRELVQLYEVYSYVNGKHTLGSNLRKKEKVAPLLWLDDETRQSARIECARIQALDQQTTSKFHQNVSHMLSKLDIEHQNEVRIGTWAIDIHLTSPGLDHVLIEVDGPRHYLHNSTTLNGPAIFKKDALSHLRWQVVSIAHFQWQSLATDEEKMAFLRDTLKPMKRVEASQAADAEPKRTRGYRRRRARANSDGSLPSS
ncbi:hypothetical protein AAMO2058_001107900 [Amorphochlora amoebiformis]